MWIPQAVFQLFRISEDTVTSLREENAALRAEQRLLSDQITNLKITADWLRIQHNQLSFERTALLNKVYGINTPAPELAKQPIVDPSWDPKQFSFDDVGEELAKKLGLPSYEAH